MADPMLHGKPHHFSCYEFDGSVLRPILLVAPCRGKIKHKAKPAAIPPESPVGSSSASLTPGHTTHQPGKA